MAVLRERLGPDASIRGIPWGESLHLEGVRVSFHPAGHILGSAQVRVENRGEVWVVAGDYKTESDPTCEPFELVTCNTFVTESTFGLPIYHWRPQRDFEGIQKSSRHKSGIAVRFPRISRWRQDKKPADADSLDALQRLAGEADDRK